VGNINWGIYLAWGKLQGLHSVWTVCRTGFELKTSQIFFVKGPATDATGALQPWGLLCNPVMKMISFFVLPCNGAPVEWNWQGKTEVHGEKTVPVPFCRPQIPHGLTRVLTRTSAVRGRRLTAWAIARPENSQTLSVVSVYSRTLSDRELFIFFKRNTNNLFADSHYGIAMFLTPSFLHCASFILILSSTLLNKY
jgi:hypothetical protein